MPCLIWWISVSCCLLRFSTIWTSTVPILWRMLIYKLVCIWNGDKAHYCYYCYCCQCFFAVICNRFPLRDANRLRQWLRNVRRINWTPSESSRLCSVHFEENDFCTNKEVDLFAQHVYVGGVNNCTIWQIFLSLFWQNLHLLNIECVYLFTECSY